MPPRTSWLPALICLAAACGDQVAETDAPTVMLTGPAEVNTATVTVTGTARDASAIAELSINGVPATSTDGFAAFTADVPLQPGPNHLVATARDEHGNVAPEAATLEVTRIDDTAPPSIVDVFPPSFAGFEGTKLTVYARVTDASPIASVTIGGVAAALDATGYWVADGVPAGPDVPIVATDRWGQSTQRMTSAIGSTPFISALAPLATEASGTLIGYEWLRHALYRYDAAGTPRTALVSGPTRGSGPALVDPTSDVLIGIAVVGDTIYAGVRRGSELRVTSIDPDTGDRSVSHTCTMPTTPIAFVAIPGPRFFATSYDSSLSTLVYECAPSSTTPTVVGQTTRFNRADNVAYDAMNQRIVVADSNTAEVDGVALASGTFTLLAAPQPCCNGARGLAVVNGTPYFASYQNTLYRVPPSSTTPEPLVQVGSNYPAAMAPCSDGTGSVLCVQSTGGSQMFTVAQGATGWTATPIPFDNLVGTGRSASALSAIAIAGPDGAARVLYSDPAGQLDELDMTSGVRTLIGGYDLGILSAPTPTGKIVTARWGATGAQLVDLSQPTPIFSPLPGPTVTPYQVAVLPAHTRLANESAVYVTSDSSSVRVRDLVTGDDTEIAQVADVLSLATQDDGTIYLGTYPDQVFRIRAGSSTVEPIGKLLSGQATSAYFDPATNKLYVGYGPLTAFDPVTLERTAVDLATFDFPSAPVGDLRPGPIPGTVLASSFGLDRAVVAFDLVRGKSFVLAR